jgi:hypothetical protein
MLTKRGREWGEGGMGRETMLKKSKEAEVREQPGQVREERKWAPKMSSIAELLHRTWFANHSAATASSGRPKLF